jgi:flagellar hook-length control protein FliK
VIWTAAQAPAASEASAERVLSAAARTSPAEAAADAPDVPEALAAPAAVSGEALASDEAAEAAELTELAEAAVGPETRNRQIALNPEVPETRRRMVQTAAVTADEIRSPEFLAADDSEGASGTAAQAETRIEPPSLFGGQSGNASEDGMEQDSPDAQGSLLQMLSQPEQRFFASQTANGGSPGVFASELPEIVLQSFQSFENAEGAHEVVIQLAPESLGRLTVRLASQDGILAIQILAHSPMTQRALESGVAGLRQALDQQGIRYQRIEVELDGYQMGHHQSGEEQASAWANRQNQGTYDQRRFQGAGLYGAAEDRMAAPEAALEGSEGTPGDSGQINYVV